MSRERFQSETGQTIDDNGCSFFTSTSPLFYTVNPRSGISLRQQEQLGAASILKSFRDLPGCTRLSSSLSNLEATSGPSKRAQFPLLPDIHPKTSMGKSLQGHHSSSKRFVRERYNPPLKVNAKIRHVYTQEVTTIEGRDQQQTQTHLHHYQQQQPSSRHVTYHRQTQTEAELFPEGRARQEVGQINEEANANKSNSDEDKLATTSAAGRTVPQTLNLENNGETDKRKVDASTSPIPSPYFPSTSPETISPFTGCSQMSVYPPLNYVKKLEDLEKITGHIVIQRFFTRTDDAFGTWLERQLGMTSKSVSVDTSEFENAKTAELHDEEVEDGADATNAMEDDNDTVGIEAEKNAEDQGQEGTISGAISNPGEGGSLQTENTRQSLESLPKVTHAADCALADNIKCECYLGEVGKAEVATVEVESNHLKEIEEQIIPVESALLSSETPTPVIGELDGDDQVETLISSESAANKEDSEKKPEKDEDIDEMVRCTLEAYLMAPMAFEELNDGGDEHEKPIDALSPLSGVKSEVDSGRADSIQSQEKMGTEGQEEIEGNTSHDSVETVYEIPMPPPKNIEMLIDETKLENESTRILQRSLSADSCIGTESSGDAKKSTTNASQSSNDTIEGLEPILAPRELVDLALGPPASAPPTITTKLPAINSSAKAMALSRRLSSCQSHRSITPCSATGLGQPTPRRKGKTDSSRNAESEDADGESETESEITDHFMIATKLKHDGTDLELEEVEEYEGDDDDNDDRDAFDTMIANHLKYSRGLSTATTRRSRLNRGTQTTKSIEPSTTSGSMSPSSSSNSSFDVEIISKSKRITTTSSAGFPESQGHHGPITPSNMTLAWHEGGRRRSYLPSSSSSLNLLNMKFSLGKDFESEVSIRMPTNKQSSTNTNMSSASMLLPGSGGTAGGKTLMSSSSRTHHHHFYPNRGLSPARHNQHHMQHQPSTDNPAQLSAEETELQSLWKDVRTKLDVQVDEISATIQNEDDTPEAEGLQVKGNGILPAELTPPVSGSTSVKLRRNEERIKRSLQRLKKILDD